MSRVVQLANFVTPTSGGLRTALEQLAVGYAAAGHEVVRVVPGAVDAVHEQPWGRQVELRAPEVPATGYRVLTDLARVRRVLAQQAPDRLEVHDRTTLRGVGRWARRHGVPALVVSHERLDRWLSQWLSQRLPLQRAADRSNAALADGFDRVVCTTAWAEQEFARLGVPHLERIALGVDLERFRPGDRPAGGPLRLVTVSRLSREKRVDLAVHAAVELARRGHAVRLRIAGHGPLSDALRRQAGDGPVELLGHVRDRAALAHELQTADVAIAPGPVETFGLAALEAMACGTPVVANTHSALPEVLGGSGAVSASTGRSFADAVERVLAVPEDERRAAARARAAQYPWSRTVEGFLRAHRLPLSRTRAST